MDAIKNIKSAGEYKFTIKAVDILDNSLSKTSDFTLVAKTNQTNVITPTLTLSNSKNTLDETSATRTAYLLNPSKLKVTSVGMTLYDSDGKVLGHCEESKSNYPEELWIYYATDNKTNVSLNYKLTPGTKYSYKFFATVGGKYYSVNGNFTTKGSPKPKTPTLRCYQTDFAEGDIINVEWDAVEYAYNGYEVSLCNSDGVEVKTISTTMTSANFVVPFFGEYTLKIIAKGSQNSDLGIYPQKIIVHDCYTVTFVMEDGDQIVTLGQPQTVKYHQDAVAPSAPAKQGWIFQGWDRSYLDVTSDMTVKAKFTRCRYQVTFKANGNVTKIMADYEGSVEPPEVPEKLENDYIFVGWDSEDYKYVTKNMEVNACYVYAYDDLPIQLEIKKCEFNSDGNGYTLTYSIENCGKKTTKGRAIASLLTSNGRLVCTTESNAFSIAPGNTAKKENVEVFIPYDGDATTAEIVIVSEFSNSIPISKKKSTDNIIRTWSAWSTTEPDASSVTDIETRTRYRYRDKQYKTDSSQYVAGWDYVATEEYWSEYGAWGKWTRDYYGTSDSRQVESKTVTDKAAYTEQNYYFYRYTNKNNYPIYSYADRTGQSGCYNVFRRDIWIGPNDSRKMVYLGTDDGHPQYKCEPYQFYQVEYFYVGSTRTIPAVTHTEYRYRYRTKLKRYKFERWGDWSDYSDTAYTKTDTRDVESITEYRYKTDAAPSVEWDGEKYQVEGKLDENLAGRQILLVVYKHEDPADYNNEYLGQSVVGADGSYSFEFYTREKPSADTGDFTIKLGIEGAKELLYIGKIDAPKKEYTVRFFDGNKEEPLKVEKVTEGNDATEPEELPYRDGYRFMGWDMGLTNVHADMDVTARYERLKCTVVFVDWNENNVLTQQYDVGDTIIPPVYKDREGYSFVGWLDEYGEEVSVASDNLVLSAVYAIEYYKVTFYDADNQELYYDYAAYGESVTAPAAPEVEGMRFARWSTYDYSSVKEDLDIYAVYEYEETTPTPVADVKSQTLDKVTKVTLSCDDPSAMIMYTTDGSTPDMFSTEYTEPITIDRNTVLQFYARSAGKNDSEIVSEAYLYITGEDDAGALSIKKDKLNLLLGEEAPKITYFLYHENPDIGVDFYTLNETVVSVDHDGQLTINNVGSTQVFAITKDGRYADYCDITVTSNEVAITSMDLSQDNVSLLVGEETELTTKIEPADATYQNVTWTSGDDEIVSVNEEGRITAQAPGSAYISAYSRSGRNIAYCRVNVENTTVAISDQEIVIAVGQQHQLTARTASNVKVSWKTDQKDIVTVSETGLVTGVSGGKGTVIAMADNGDFRTCTVRVTTGPEAAPAPNAPKVLAVTATTIEIEEQEGCEYSLDGINWQTDTTFTSLLPNTQYYVFARVRETEITLASPASTGTPVVTEKALIDEDGQLTAMPPNAPKVIAVTDTTIEVEAQEGCEYSLDGIHWQAETIFRDLTPNTQYFVYARIATTETLLASPASQMTMVKTAEAQITVSDIPDQIYTGEKLTPKIEIYYGSSLLTEEKDYTVSYRNNIEASDSLPSVTVEGIGFFEGTITKNFKILPKDINANDIFVKDIILPYSGEMQKPIPEISYADHILISGKDFSVAYPDSMQGAYTANGDYSIAIKGTGNYSGTRQAVMTITDKALINGAKVKVPKAVKYSGEKQTVTLSVSLNGKVLREKEDYVIEYPSAKDGAYIYAGSWPVAVRGVGEYAGVKYCTMKISALPIKKAVISGVKNINWDGKAAEQSGVTVLLNGNTLRQNEDYVLIYHKNYKAGKAKIEAKGINGYKGSATKTFKINPYDIQKNEADALQIIGLYDAVNYVKGGAKFDFSIYCDGNLLIENKDYTVKYKNNKNISDGGRSKKVPSVTIKGKGSYKGTIKHEFAIHSQKISSLNIEVSDVFYSKQEGYYKAKPVISDINGEKLIAGKDYDDELKYLYMDETPVGYGETPAIGSGLFVVVTGKGCYEGTGRAYYRIAEKNIEESKADQLICDYTGSTVLLQAGQLKLRFGEELLTEGKDFEILEDSYRKNNSPGTATVCIKGLGRFGGTKKIRFTIQKRKI